MQSSTMPKKTATLGELTLTGAEARAYRIKTGLRQHEIAKRMGATQGRISQIEASSDLRPSTISQLAAAFELPPTEFVRAAIKAARDANGGEET